MHVFPLSISQFSYNVACDNLAINCGYHNRFRDIAKKIFDSAEAADASQTVADGTNFNFYEKWAFDKIFGPENDFEWIHVQGLSKLMLVDFKTT